MSRNIFCLVGLILFVHHMKCHSLGQPVFSIPPPYPSPQPNCLELFEKKAKLIEKVLFELSYGVYTLRSDTNDRITNAVKLYFNETFALYEDPIHEKELLATETQINVTQCEPSIKKFKTEKNKLISKILDKVREITSLNVNPAQTDYLKRYNDIHSLAIQTLPILCKNSISENTSDICDTSSSKFLRELDDLIWESQKDLLAEERNSFSDFENVLYSVEASRKVQEAMISAKKLSEEAVECLQTLLNGTEEIPVRVHDPNNPVNDRKTPSQHRI